ncbi:MAG TPA: 3-hydroxyacyl-CoA dehydrogenase NAD-binding domain-containing protein [Chthoniobacteraceae bacterium]|nr:3-hydroxyacyl-CoA dehydrogenase NAD-binding domain-containing protein [Chthoniobacteraceae bacterium]
MEKRKTPSKRLLVVGTGTMGRGIAQAAATAGWTVHLHDAKPGVAGQCIEKISESLERSIGRSWLAADQLRPTLERLLPASNLRIAGEVDVVLEAIWEELTLKQNLFRELEEIVDEKTFFWTNTSMLSVTGIAAPLRHPERLVGTHFFNPVPRMKLVEVIAGRATSPDAVVAAENDLRQWGKTTVRAPDSPGFIVNRIFDVIKREALMLLQEGVPAAEIDRAVKLGLNFPMGPFEVMDLVGLDTTLACLKTQASRTGSSDAPGTALEELVRRGDLGRKSGSGFYSYPPRRAAS